MRALLGLNIFLWIIMGIMVVFSLNCPANTLDDFHSKKVSSVDQPLRKDYPTVIGYTPESLHSIKFIKSKGVNYGMIEANLLKRQLNEIPFLSDYFDISTTITAGALYDFVNKPIILLGTKVSMFLTKNYTIDAKVSIYSDNVTNISVNGSGYLSTYFVYSKPQFLSTTDIVAIYAGIKSKNIPINLSDIKVKKFDLLGTPSELLTVGLFYNPYFIKTFAFSIESNNDGIAISLFAGIK